jgi:hypothetical protein
VAGRPRFFCLTDIDLAIFLYNVNFGAGQSIALRRVPAALSRQGRSGVVDDTPLRLPSLQSNFLQGPPSSPSIGGDRRACVAAATDEEDRRGVERPFRIHSRTTCQATFRRRAHHLTGSRAQSIAADWGEILAKGVSRLRAARRAFSALGRAPSRYPRWQSSRRRS